MIAGNILFRDIADFREKNILRKKIKKLTTKKKKKKKSVVVFGCQKTANLTSK